MPELTEELLGRLLQSAASLSRPQAERLIDEVRQQVESEVRELIHSAWKAALLREVVAELQQQQDSPPCADPRASRPSASSAEARCSTHDQPPSAAGPTTSASEPTGIYAYGIASSADRLLAEALTAAEPVFPVELIRRGELQAIISRVPLGEFAPESWSERLADLDWIEAKARAHDRVLKSALGQGPLIPLRFGTVFHSEQDLLRLLEDDCGRLRETLGRLVGKSEWGVKIGHHATAGLAAAVGRPPDRQAAAAQPASGRAYLQDKQRQRHAKNAARQEAFAIAQQCHEILSASACEAVTQPLEHRNQRNGDSAIILNGSYLLEHSQLEPFHSCIESLANRYQASGISLETTGPWPPYHFVNMEISGDAHGSVAVGR